MRSGYLECMISGMFSDVVRSSSAEHTPSIEKEEERPQHLQPRFRASIWNIITEAGLYCLADQLLVRLRDRVALLDILE